MRTYSSKSVAKRGLERLMKRHPFIVGGAPVIDDHHYRLSIVIDALASEVPSELFEEFDVTIKDKEPLVQLESEAVEAVEEETEAVEEATEAVGKVISKEELKAEIEAELKTELKAEIEADLRAEFGVKTKGKSPKTKSKREFRNGMFRPRSTSTSGQMWDLFDARHSQHGVFFKGPDLKNLATVRGWNLVNLRTQYWDWKKFNGLLDKQTKD